MTAAAISVTFEIRSRTELLVGTESFALSKRGTLASALAEVGISPPRPPRRGLSWDEDHPAFVGDSGDQGTTEWDGKALGPGEYLVVDLPKLSNHPILVRFSAS
jgi:hypothetical protein